MAVKGITTDDAVTKKVWDESAFREARKEMYISKFMGKDSSAMIYEKTQLEKDMGDNITFTMFPRAQAPIVLGSTGEAVEGKEGKFEQFTDSITLEEYNTSFRTKNKGTIDAQRPWFNLTDENATALEQWSSEVMDNLWFEAIQASPTKIVYGGDAVSVATLEAADKLNPTLIRRLRAMAKTGFATGSNARKAYPFKPIKIGGVDYYVLLVHPYAVYDMKENAAYQQSVREAMERSKNNPIFTGAVAVIDNVIIHEHENIQIKQTTSSSGIYYCTGVFMGAGSSIWAWGKRWSTYTEYFDYGREIGVNRSMIAATKKTSFKFTSTGSAADYGSCGVYIACTDVVNVA